MYVKCTRTSSRAVGSGMRDLVVRNERQIDSHGCANQGLIGGIASREKVETSRKCESTRAPLVPRIARDSISRYDGR